MTVFNFLLILTIVLFLLTGVLSFYLIRFVRIVFRMEDAIDESINILNKSQDDMMSILETPVFFDSTEIRKALQIIERSRSSILDVAEKISLGQVSIEVEEN